MTTKGTIELIIGPALSGKTTELLQRLNRYTHRCYSCLSIIHEHTTMLSKTTQLITRDKRVSKCDGIVTTDLKSDEAIIMKYDVIGIDDSHYFEIDPLFIDTIASNGKIVIITSLQSTFYRKSIPSVKILIPIAEVVTQLYAVCHFCSQMNVSFTMKNTIQTCESPYEYTTLVPVCRSCYNTRNSTSSISSTISTR